MIPKPLQSTIIIAISLLQVNLLLGQDILTLEKAINNGVTNFGSIQSKSKLVDASKEAFHFTKSEFLPNLNTSIQWNYGTVNGQIAPGYGFGGLGVSSSGLPSTYQNWNAAFGSSYITNFNWDMVTFGKRTNKMRVSHAEITNKELDLEQEVFQHKIKVANTYLNLLIAQRIRISQEQNLERARSISQVVKAKAINGLAAGVDTSLINAEISNAKISLTRALDTEQEQTNLLTFYMGQSNSSFLLDTTLISQTPNIASTAPYLLDNYKENSILKFNKSRLNIIEAQKQYTKSLYYPNLSVAGVFQTRGSGFGYTYASNQTDYTSNLFKGINPTRSNFILGMALTWNLTQPIRFSKQLKMQNLIEQSILSDISLVENQFSNQIATANNKLINAYQIYLETPAQITAAKEAYKQKYTLYKNGLTTFVDLNQAFYALIRAEVEKEIAINSLWQNLLLKAAATGDLSLFNPNL